MKKLLNIKLIIPIVVGLVLIGGAAYILFAPSTWWKPIYIRFEMNAAAATPEAEATKEEQAGSQPAEQTKKEATSDTAKPSTSEGNSMDRKGWGVMYPLDSKVVNLADPGGLRYLQATVVLEFWPMIKEYDKLEGEEKTKAEEEFKKKIEAIRPVIDDIVMTILSSKTFADISTLEGKQKLKDELINEINKAMGYEGVMAIYFTEFVVQ